MIGSVNTIGTPVVAPPLSAKWASVFLHAMLYVTRPGHSACLFHLHLGCNLQAQDV
jgi:hypothetical protein